MVPSEKELLDALMARHGKEMSEKLGRARVAVCGLGGLGSNAAVALARAGVGHIHLIDFDRVEISNLNRQQYFIDQLGKPKTEALRRTLLRICPYGDLSAECVRLTSENIPSVLSGDDIIIEAFDDAEQKAMLVNSVLETFQDKYVISGSGMAGLGSANLIKTRKVGKRLYVCGDGTSDVSEMGSLFSARVMACASHEALTALRIISGLTEP